MSGSSAPAVRIAPLLLILLMTMATKADVDAMSSAPVHGVSVAVRSARSVRYHGMQVPLFENIGSEGSGRYFFPPLALLDCNSTQVTPASGAEASDAAESVRRTALRLTILLWTDEFLSAARDQIALSDANASAAGSAHVELVPMTELALTWTGQAKQWLGVGFEGRFQLLGDWQEAQKPRERITFTILCNQTADCRSLLTHFSDTDGSASHLFDLKYRIRCNTQRRFSVPLASRHLLRSPLFVRLRRFAAKKSGIVLTTETTIEQLATELRAAALNELQEQQFGEQRASSVDAAAMAALSADAGRLLRQVPVTGAGSSQWADVFWQQPGSSGRQLSGGSGLRPDRLASLLNRLLVAEASGRPRLVQLVPKAMELFVELASEGELHPTAMTTIRRFLTSRGGSEAEPIDVDEVRELAATLDSPVVWDAGTVGFVPSPAVQLYELNTGRLLQVGIFALRDITLQYRVSEQRDHVTPLCRAVHASVDYSEESWQAQLELLSMRMRPLLQRATKAAAELRRVEAALAAAKAESGSDAQVRERSSDSEGGGAETPVIRSSIEAARSRLEALDSSLSGLADADAAAPWQPRFADSYCVLANSGPPPRGMSCRTISFVIPKKSLQTGILQRQLRISLGTAGQSMIEVVGEKFYRFQLRGCCK